MLPGILQQLGPEGLQELSKKAVSTSAYFTLLLLCPSLLYRTRGASPVPPMLDMKKVENTRHYRYA